MPNSPYFKIRRKQQGIGMWFSVPRPPKKNFQDGSRNSSCSEAEAVAHSWRSARPIEPSTKPSRRVAASISPVFLVTEVIYPVTIVTLDRIKGYQGLSWYVPMSHTEQLGSGQTQPFGCRADNIGPNACALVAKAAAHYMALPSRFREDVCWFTHRLTNSPRK